MPRLLYVKCSPRGEASRSSAIATTFLDAYRETHPEAEIEEFDIWTAGLPEYDGDAAAAKMSFFGEDPMNDTQKAAYAEMVALFEQFNAADDYLFSIPMWNFGVPYKLKQYIDLLTMPGTLFGFDPAVGYLPLLKNKRATAIYSAALYHDGASKAWGSNHVSTHFTNWLNFAGVTDVATIWFQKYKMLDEAGLEAALATVRAEAAAAARR